jgi:hypothetical protein
MGPSLSIDHSFGRSGATRKGRDRCFLDPGRRRPGAASTERTRTPPVTNGIRCVAKNTYRTCR